MPGRSVSNWVIAHFRRSMEKICPIISLRHRVFKTKETFSDACSIWLLARVTVDQTLANHVTTSLSRASAIIGCRFLMGAPRILSLIHI